MPPRCPDESPRFSFVKKCLWLAFPGIMAEAYWSAMAFSAAYIFYSLIKSSCLLDPFWISELFLLCPFSLSPWFPIKTMLAWFELLCDLCLLLDWPLRMLAPPEARLSWFRPPTEYPLMFYGDCVKLNRDGPPDFAVVVMFPALPMPTEPPFD